MMKKRNKMERNEMSNEDIMLYFWMFWFVFGDGVAFNSGLFWIWLKRVFYIISIGRGFRIWKKGSILFLFAVIEWCWWLFWRNVRAVIVGTFFRVSGGGSIFVQSAEELVDDFVFFGDWNRSEVFSYGSCQFWFWDWWFYSDLELCSILFEAGNG